MVHLTLMTRERILHLTKRDFTRQTFRAGGKGGQKQNKTESGVRFIHEPSGARGESREARGQLENERIAFLRLANSPVFRSWVSRYGDAYTKRDIDAEVKEMMRSDNIRVEVKNEDGLWVEVPSDEVLPDSV